MTRRLRHIVRRSLRHARRLGAAFRSVGPGRHPGGVDSVVVCGAQPTVVSGWVRARRRPLATIVRADGVPVAIAQTNDTDPRAAPRIVAWHVVAELPVHATTIDALAVFEGGIVERLDAGRVERHDVILDEVRESGDTGPRCFLDSPKPGMTVTGPLLHIAGWVIDDALATVEVTVDGRAALARPMAVPRPDIAELTGSKDASVCGFEHFADVSQIRAGEWIEVSAVAVDELGERRRIDTVRVVVGPTIAPPAHDENVVSVLRARAVQAANRHRPASRGVNLLIVTHDLGLGGGQLYLHELLTRLVREHGVRAAVIAPTTGPLHRSLEAMDVEVFLTGAYPTRAANYESTVRQLVAIAGDLEASAVLANTAATFIGVDVGGLIGVPTLWAIHESYPPDHFLALAFGAGTVDASVAQRFRESLANASAVIFEADATRRLYEAHGESGRFIRVPYGIPIASVDMYRASSGRTSCRTERGFTPDDVVLLSIATIEPRKSQTALLHVFARLSIDHPEAVLVLVGDTGDAYSVSVRAYADQLGLGDRVRIESVSDDVYGWYHAADVFVLPSDVESLPRSVLEAMAFELPVLAADVFGVSEVVEHGATGWLIPPRDLAALESGIRHVLEMDAPELSRLGRAGAAFVRAHHDSRGYAADYRTLLDGLAADPKALPNEMLRHIPTRS